MCAVYFFIHPLLNSGCIQFRIEYGKVISQLSKVGYSHALSFQIAPMPDIDQRGELRKLRLLLDTLL